MLEKLIRISFLFIALAFGAPSARAQDRPLSPPERPPVPLSESDQQRARDEELARIKPGAEKSPASSQPPVKAQPLHSGRHVSSGNELIDAIVSEAAARHGLDPCLVLSVMKAESGFNKTAVSVKGASGLMQLMPATAARFGVKNIFDQRENVLAGARYLRWLLDRFNGDVRLALAGYNAGEGAVEFYGYKIPPYLETQNYVRIIYGRYSRIHGLESPPPVQAAVADAAREKIPTYKEKIPTYNQIIRFTSSSGGR
ncbi:MAG TPA: lytic transglycosylase domain-containing protein [Blastocatellia bacterium]|nr:lytic transglycosylase domain-containing protein [Blastocatellia bacterium]